MSGLSTAELRVESSLWEGFLEARQIHMEPIQECCSCGTRTDYGCTVPLADGTEPFACQACNADPERWDEAETVFTPAAPS